MSRIATVLLLLASMAVRLGAQHVLLAEDGGTMALVRAAKGSRACVEKNGKIEEISSSKGFVLKDVPEYLPVFVSVQDLQVRTTYDQTNSGGQVNNNFHLSASIETAYRLTDVFLVLYIESELGTKAIFLNEIAKLEPNKSIPVVIFVPMDQPMGRGHYTLYLFSGGAEVFQTQIPFLARENALDRMVAARVKDVDAAAPKFFVGPPPQYPAALKKSGTKGQAIISVRIAVNGDVEDPVVKSATDPAFGDAALTAIRIWRFLPKVKDGHPVETKADVPFLFSPPKES
jgi:TonB family protein